MPLRSMTGFGQAKKATPSGTYRVDIRGVNNRYLEIQFRTPRSFSSLEQKMKQLISTSICRGSLSVNIYCEGEQGESSLTWDKDKVAGYVRIFKEIKSNFKLGGQISLRDLLALSDVIKIKTGEFDEEKLWRHSKPVIEKAIKQFNSSREQEAVAISKQFTTMTDKILSALDKIEQLAPARLKTYQENLKRRIETLAGTAVEPQRLAAEVAIMADKLDIAEECTRLRVHIAKFREDLTSEDPAGKRMTFILQEMNREANTIGSKSNDVEISHFSVTIKEMVEQMREQAQNIE